MNLGKNKGLKNQGFEKTPKTPSSKQSTLVLSVPIENPCGHQPLKSLPVVKNELRADSYYFS